MQSLVEKYRPKRLRDVRGQKAVVDLLSLFARRPCSRAFLFHGPSGVGKTCTATALAAELGILPELGEIGGLYEIASGAMNADNVRKAVERLAYSPMRGSGWRMLLCNEADRMTTVAETIWLDALEHLPPRSVVVFTTNAPEQLPRRFCDRCAELRFEQNSNKLLQTIRRFVRAIWKWEVGPDVPFPRLTHLGRPSSASPDSAHPSFRLALQQLEPHVWAHQAGGDLPSTAA
jgi:DNA polymerase III gamma/tau subunit